MYTDTINSLYYWGVEVIQDLQTRFEPYDEFILMFSHLADPGYTFSIIFPILSAINTLLAANVLMATAMSAWSNTILKLLLREHRPYWWVHETTMYGKEYPELVQTPLTCETGPGSPSGHLMNAGALFYVVISSFINYYTECSTSDTAERVIRFIFWNLYILILVMVSVSRSYISAHFPHQCILGAILGYIIGRMFGTPGSNITELWHKCRKGPMFIFVLSLALLTIVLNYAEKLSGLDPSWSVKLAYKWCEKTSYIHVTTTPMYSMVRELGLGLGIASVSPVLRKLPRNKRHSPVIGAAWVAIYCLVLYFAQTAVPSRDVRLFYLVNGFLYMTMPFVLLGLLPKFAAIKKVRTR